MTDKYKNLYRIPSARWQNWDYGANAAYFVTICTAHREQFFGEIRNGEMTLTEIGQIACDCWTQIPAHFPFAVLGAFVVMPNHMHGVIVIDKPDEASPVSVVPMRVSATPNVGGCPKTPATKKSNQ